MATENSHTLPDADVGQGSCRHLRSKGMFITGCANPAVEDGQVGDGHCWCNLTQHVLGPDDDFVERRICTSGRACFVATI
jgi:hypothetical protein